MSSVTTVVVTRPLPDPGARRLVEAGVRVVVNDEDRPWSAVELGSALADADGVITMLSDRIDAPVLDAAPACGSWPTSRSGSTTSTCRWRVPRGVEVTTTPGVLTDATADLAWALLLAAARRLGEGDRLIRSGGWAGWGPSQLLGRPVSGQRLGIVGMGAIGQAVARRAVGFGMTVTYHNRRRLPVDVERAHGATWLPLDELLATSDVVSLHAPLNADSHHLIDAEALRRMMPTAVLVNTARGALVDEAALVVALDRGSIAAAGLDVFEAEPIVHPGLLGRDDVVVTPHLGSATTTARSDMVELCIENVLRVLDGQPAVTPAPG